MSKIENLQLKVFRVEGPYYAVKLCNNGNNSLFVEQGALDVFSRNTKVTVLAWPSNIKCLLKSKINDTLLEIKQESCITSAIDFKPLCDLTKLKPGHYDILYETNTKVCTSDYKDNQCISSNLAGTVEYGYYPDPGPE